MNKIPKIIHYCWFGHNKMPKFSLKYIKGWEKKCPNFKIIKWSENNFDINKYSFAKKAYEEHNWAALSDYVRLVVLNKFGGIYLDTDVEIIKPLTSLLYNKSFVGMEDYGVINSGLIYGAHPNDDNINNLIKIYNSIGHLTTANLYMNDQVHITTTYFHKLGFKYNNERQLINGCVIYPISYFCPMRYYSTKVNITRHTYTFHHYFGTWTNKDKLSKQHFHYVLRKVVRAVLGTKIFFALYRKYLYYKKGNI